MRHHIELGERRLSYLEAGAPAAPLAAATGTLVLLHAFPLSAEMWRPQLAAVPPGWRFIAPDLAGFGQSSSADVASPRIEDYAADIVTLLDRLGIGTAVIAGLSMGGYVAFALLRQAADRVTGLVLADTRPGADSTESRAARERMIEQLRREGPSSVAETMIPGLLGAATRASRPELVAKVRQLAASQAPDAIRQAIVRLMTRPDSRGLLPGLALPTLVIVGEQDQITDPAAAREMHALIGTAELAVIPEAGHLSNLEQPDRFNAVLAGWLGKRG